MWKRRAGLTAILIYTITLYTVPIIYPWASIPSSNVDIVMSGWLVNSTYTSWDSSLCTFTPFAIDIGIFWNLGLWIHTGIWILHIQDHTDYMMTALIGSFFLIPIIPIFTCVWVFHCVPLVPYTGTITFAPSFIYHLIGIILIVGAWCGICGVYIYRKRSRNDENIDFENNPVIPNGYARSSSLDDLEDPGRSIQSSS